MATYNSKDNQVRPMQAINILVSGKTDSELLSALVSCIMDNDNDLLAALRKTAQDTYSDKTRSNVEVLAAIVDFVNHRLTTEDISHASRINQGHLD